jgi:ATP-binding cassette subfamily B protein
MPTTFARYPLLRLLRYARGHHAGVLRGCVYSVTNKIFDLAPPVLIGAAVDVVVSGEKSFLAQFGFTDVALQLWLLAGLTLGIWGLESLFEYLSSLAWRNTAQSIQHDLRVDAVRHVQTLEMAYFEDRSSADLMAVINDDVNQLERFLDSGAHEIILLLTTIVVVGGIFVFLVPSLAWMVLLPMPIIAWGSMKFQKVIAPRYAEVRAQAGFVNTQLATTLGGIATVKSFTAEEHETERIRRSSEQYREKNRAAIQFSSAFVPLIRMVIVLGFAAIMVYGGQQAASGALNVGAYSILVFMTQRLLWPLTRLGTTLDLYHRAMASTERVLSVLERSTEILDGSRSLPVAVVRGEIEFDSVSFSYRRGGATLSNLSLHIPAGQTIGFVGATGSGKTTLIKLLLRFYDIGSGAIRLDGHELSSLRLADLRAAIGLVSQETFLIDASIRDNIAYGTFGASEAKIVAAAKIAEVHEFISSLPLGYDTVVGERGQKLSGGQRQRISIARAVLKDPPILVLDEATSSVDNETEAAIQRALYRIAHTRTMLIVAHRLSTVRHADTIFVLEKGKIVEQGSHERLLEVGGVYASLWRVQTGEIGSGAGEVEPDTARMLSGQA